jgi:hypothetical protein
MFGKCVYHLEHTTILLLYEFTYKLCFCLNVGAFIVKYLFYIFQYVTFSFTSLHFKRFELVALIVW